MAFFVGHAPALSEARAASRSNAASWAALDTSSRPRRSRAVARSEAEVRILLSALVEQIDDEIALWQIEARDANRPRFRIGRFAENPRATPAQELLLLLKRGSIATLPFITL